MFVNACNCVISIAFEIPHKIYLSLTSDNSKHSLFVSSGLWMGIFDVDNFCCLSDKSNQTLFHSSHLPEN